MTNFVDNSNIIDITVVDNQVILSDTGLTGPRGNSILNGIGEPTNETGVQGDFYLDIEVVGGRPKYHLYGPKTYSEWPVVDQQTGNRYVDLFTLPESNFIHTVTQNQASDTWVIEHNLGFFPNVTTVDSAYTQVEGNVVYNSINRVTIYFSTAFAGYAYLS